VATYRAGPNTGAYTVTATAGSLQKTFNLSNIAVPATITGFTDLVETIVNTNFGTLAGHATLPVARVLDKNKNGVQGIIVTRTALPVASGSNGAPTGSFPTTASSTTDANGNAKAPTILAGMAAGNWT